jgi:hypothetical protein
MNELNIKRRVEAKPYPRQYTVDRTPMIRLYRSSPSGATLQLRGKNAYATADYVDHDEIRALIAKLEEIDRELVTDRIVIVPKQLMREHDIEPSHKKPWFWPLDEEDDERGSEG